MKKIIFIFILISTLIVAKELPKEKSLIEGKLENGFKYSIIKNGKPKNRAEFRLIVKVGSLEEDDDQKGIAHFVEHMAFNGSKHFKKNELIQYLESIGVKFGSHLNASTGYEKTLYKLTVPLEKDNLEKSFLVFRDWASGLNFDKEEFNKERGVILEEARSRDTASFRIYNKYKSMVFEGTKYIDRLPIGDLDIIRNISVDRAKDFYDDWYRPEHMHFIAVGDFDTKSIKELIIKHFSALKNSSKRELASREIKENNQTRVRSLSEKEITANSLSVQYLDFFEDSRTKEDVRIGLIESMMISLFNIKAKEQLLKNDPKATTIRLVSGAINSKRASYNFKVSYRDNNDRPALKELYELIWSFYKYGFSKEDLRLLKKQKLDDNEREYKRLSDRRSSSIASMLVHYAMNKSIYIDYDYKYRLKKELISDISIEEINSKFKEVINFKDRVILFVNTTGDKISKEEALETIQSAKEGAEDFSKIKKTPNRLLKNELVPKKILSKKYNKKTGIYEYSLENGMRVLFKQTDFSKNRVSMSGFSFGGQSLYGVEDLDNAKKTTQFISKSGAGEFSNIDISKILAGKNVSTALVISDLTENIYGSADSSDLDMMFELLYLKLTQPKIDKIVAKNTKKLLKYRAEQSDRNPKTKFQKEFKLHYNKNHPRVFFDTAKSVERLDSAKMLKIFKDRFSDMNNFTIALVGDIEPKKVESAISKYLANLPTKKREEKFRDIEIAHLKGEQKFIRSYNNENITQIGIFFKSRLSYNPKRMVSLNAMTSIMKIRLRELIREEKSGVYGIGINSTLARLRKNQSSIHISFSCDPKRADELTLEIYRAIDRLKKDGVTNKELEVYRKKFSVERENLIKENSYWLSKIITAYKTGSSVEDEIFKTSELVKNISKEDIKKIANEIFDKDVIEARLNPKKS